jgi:hypothetical protein
MDHLRSQFFGERLHKLGFPVYFSGIADQAAEADAARFGKLGDPLEMLLAAYMAIISPEQTM